VEAFLNPIQVIFYLELVGAKKAVMANIVKTCFLQNFPPRWVWLYGWSVSQGTLVSRTPSSNTWLEVAAMTAMSSSVSAPNCAANAIAMILLLSDASRTRATRQLISR
jgi:hypothetical protein